MEKYAGDRSMPAAFRGQVSQWLSEYSETNHARMLKVVETLKRMDGDRYHSLSAADKGEVFKIGCDIGSAGGIDAQQACFYVAANFIAPADKRVACVKYLWNGAGDWEM